MGKKAVVKELLYDSGTPDNLDKLKKLYKKDPHKARVIFLSKNVKLKTQTRIYKFIYDNGDIEFSRYEQMWGISITNRMYTHSRRKALFYYKKETNRFYAKNGSYINYEPNLMFFTQAFGDYWGINGTRRTLISDNDFIKEFPYLRFILEKETELNFLKQISFNTILRNKLFSYKKLIRFYSKLPYPVFKFFINLKEDSYRTRDVYSFFLNKDFHKTYGRFIKNIENIQEDWLSLEKIKEELNKSMTITSFWQIVIDSIKFSKTLNKQFNFSWSIKRVKQEHDELYKEIVHISSEFDNRPMKINDVFLQFAEHSGFEVITHTSRLRLEGINNNNCVYTRLSSVESGSSAIFSIEGHTCQIGRDYKNGLCISEISGHSNTSADNSVISLINEKLDSFNTEVLKINPTKFVSPGVYAQERDNTIYDAPPDFQRFEYNDLPF